MNTQACATTEQLLAWWLGESDAAEATRVDEHLFACGHCAGRLQSLVELGDAIRRETLRGTFGFVVPAAFVASMKQHGVTLREYYLEPGGSVNCTIAPDDDFVVANLQAHLTDVQRLDLLVEDPVLGKARLTDVPFDAATGTLAVVPSAAFLRTLQFAQQRMRLVAVETTGERVLGDYTFNHAPFAAR